MLCDHQIVTDHLVDYIDDKLSPQVRRQFEQAIESCESCAQAYHQAVQLNQAAHQWHSQAVPEWHRTQYAVRPRQTGGNWLSWSALATSAIAILMVIFQVQITTSEQGMQIAFGSDSKQIDAMVEQKLAQYKQQQDLMLDARFVAESEKQSTAAQLLLTGFMEKAREERRDDLNFLITGIQTQRFQDMQKFDKRLSYLADSQIENTQYINKLIQSADFTKGE